MAALSAWKRSGISPARRIRQWSTSIRGRWSSGPACSIRLESSSAKTSSAGPRSEKQTQQSLGSGFIIDKEGHVLTNRHVVDGADEIQVTLASGKTLDAKLVGKDARTDVALLKIDSKDPLTPIELGDSDQVEPGEWVMAIGNPFGLGGNSVTVGVVSFKGRDTQLGVQGTTVEMIQTDASINPGNSGGPLINTRGQVVGINTMIVTGGEPQSAGVGFSVPINVAREILAQLREKGKVMRGWLGVGIGPLGDDLAKTYGIEAWNGNRRRTGDAWEPGGEGRPQARGCDPRGGRPEDQGQQRPLCVTLSSKAPGTVVKLSVHRDNSPSEIAVTLGTFQDETAEADRAESGKPQLGMTLRDLTPSLAEPTRPAAGHQGCPRQRGRAGYGRRAVGPSPGRRHRQRDRTPRVERRGIRAGHRGVEVHRRGPTPRTERAGLPRHRTEAPIGRLRTKTGSEERGIP